MGLPGLPGWLRDQRVAGLALAGAALIFSEI
jgi:hypothetical protein